MCILCNLQLADNLLTRSFTLSVMTQTLWSFLIKHNNADGTITPLWNCDTSGFTGEKQSLKEPKKTVR